MTYRKTLSTVSLALDVLWKQVADVLKCNVVFDPDLTYEQSLRLVRGKKDKTDDDGTSLPMFAWNRGILTRSDARNMRGIQLASSPADEDQFIDIKLANGEIPIRWQFTCQTMEELENFEVYYNCLEGIADIMQIYVDLKQFGIHEYQVRWEERLETIITQAETNTYISVLGSCSLDGNFILLGGDSPLITEIIATTYQDSAMNHQIGQLIITP